jgi:asparagine synthase (glutamine-hydrolysing)
MVRAFRSDDSLVAGIHRLPPAHYLEVSREGVSLARYWQLDRGGIGGRTCSAEQAAKEMRQLVDEAVLCRLPRTGETGAHLSGGLDSSAIAVLAARGLRDRGCTLHAYSFLDRPRNDVALEDETAFVRAVVEQEANIDCTAIPPPPGLSALDEAIDIDKIAPLGPEAPENAVCARAEQQGVGLVLSGWGGDEGASFNGGGALAELFMRGRWRTLAREISALSRERGWPRSAIFRREVLFPLRDAVMPPSVLRLARRLAGKEGPDLHGMILKSLSPAARRRLAASPGPGLGSASDAGPNRWRLMTRPQIAHRLEIWAQTGARHGLAFAFPLLDRRVVEFALSLPSELFLRGGFRRRLFRDAMVDVLPDSVRLRHQKYQPFPGGALVLADRKDELLARVAAYEQNETVRAVIDLTYLRQQIEASPSPERVRQEMRDGENPTAPPAMIAASHVLMIAEYLAQHGGDRS